MPDPDITTVLSFRQALRECEKCSLHIGTTPVPWFGDMEPTFALMGEAPGLNEEKQQRAFVGKSGNYLRHWLREIGIDDNEVTMFNSVACRPGGNRTPDPEELHACRPWVHGQLEFIRPKVLITVGTVAFHQILGRNKPKLANLHGKPLFIPHFNCQWLATYHPAAAIRGHRKDGVKYEQLIKQDLKELVRLMGEGLPWSGLDECYICGRELYRYDEFGIGMCEVHAQHQGQLFPVDVK